MEEVSAVSATSMLKGALEFQSSMAAQVIQSGAQTADASAGDGLRAAALHEQGVGQQIDIAV